MHAHTCMDCDISQVTSSHGAQVPAAASLLQTESINPCSSVAEELHDSLASLWDVMIKIVPDIHTIFSNYKTNIIIIYWGAPHTHIPSFPCTLFWNKTKIQYDVRAEKLKTLNQKQKILVPWQAVSIYKEKQRFHVMKNIWDWTLH